MTQIDVYFAWDRLSFLLSIAGMTNLRRASSHAALLLFSCSSCIHFESVFLVYVYQSPEKVTAPRL